MRLFEGIFLALTICSAVLMLWRRMRITERAMLSAALLAMLLQVIFEGAHWQILPGYAAVVVLLFAVFASMGRSRRVHLTACATALFLAGISIASFLVLPVFRLPDPTGPYAVGTTVLYLTDSSRIDDAAPIPASARQVKVQLWYPATVSTNPLARYREMSEAGAVMSYQNVIRTHSRVDAPIQDQGGPFPIVLFNPGWHGRRTQNTALVEELASHGYVVAGIDHLYNAGHVSFPDGRVIVGNPATDISNPWSSTPERVRNIFSKELVKWAADDSFVLDTLLHMNEDTSSRWFGKLNADQVAAVGHSFGGATAVQVCATDKRIHAAVNMDGWMFEAIQARGSGQKLMVLYAFNPPPTEEQLHSSEPSVRGLAMLDSTDNAYLESSLEKFGGDVITVKGVKHEDFTDQPLMSPFRSVVSRGTVPARQIQKIVSVYVLAFLDDSLRGQQNPILQANTSPFPGVSYRFWPEPISPVAHR